MQGDTTLTHFLDVTRAQQYLPERNLQLSSKGQLQISWSEGQQGLQVWSHGLYVFAFLKICCLKLCPPSAWNLMLSDIPPLGSLTGLGTLNNESILRINLFFFNMLFLSNLYTQSRAQTHNLEMKSCAIYTHFLLLKNFTAQCLLDHFYLLDHF